MTARNAPSGGLVSDERALASLSHELADTFAPMVSAATVDRYLRRSYEAAAGASRIQTHLLLTARRLAVAQLDALARAAVAVAPTIVLHASQPSGRAQIASAWLNHHAEGQVRLRTTGLPPARYLDASIIEILSRMRLQPDWEEPEEATPELLDGADLVIPVDDGVPVDGPLGRNRIYWRAVQPVSAEDYFQTLSMTTELNIEVRALLAHLHI